MLARDKIIKSYAEWTVLSALRSGSPIKSRVDVYGILKKIDFSDILDKSRDPITREEFENWHKETLFTLTTTCEKLKHQFGWAAKIINIYLKTYCYIGDGGRINVRECLHPPIDSGLWKGIKRKYKNTHHIFEDTHSKETIKEITTHESYLRIITGLRKVSLDRKCCLIEVEELWENNQPRHLP
ncbi:hypothetical protein PGC34_11015 [Pseudomonas kribbensis]|uniref:hypothetical protein n=1 Tax=Pseudomonas kribbensis TaxID=1628086 RepID=UPI003BF8A808